MAIVLFGALTLLALVATGFASAVVQSWLKDLPDAKQVAVAETTKIYSADGKLLANLYLENREVVPLDKMSKHLQHGVIAVEDERFYTHEGYDPYGILRAAMKDLGAGSVKEGASTITQQYVRNTMLSREATQQTAARKIREIYLAQEFEKRYSKDQILAGYLNTVYFGQGSYGAEAAAKQYFGKSASDLTIAQAAMLAGIPQSPSRLDPYKHPKAAATRQHWVLDKMLQQRYITKKEYDKAVAEKLVYKSAISTTEGVYEAPYFVAHVKKQLQNMYSTSVVFKGGLRVYTTLDTRLQTIAERSRDDVLGRPDDPSVALVSIDPNTGYIRAMVGGKDFNKSKFNLATQGKRQPGSSFKTFVLVTALEHGIPPYRAISSDSPAIIPWKPNPWIASNSEGKGNGYITIEEATRNSVNTVFARLIEELGPAEVVLTAHRMGIASWLPAYPSIALGSQNVTPLEMASAYGTLAANGVHYKPATITKVVRSSDGKVLYAAKPTGTQALSKQIAYATTQLLQQVISGGTGTGAQINRPEAGKTGTSQAYRDAWFVGYTPQLVTSVWVGYNTERSMDNVRGIRVFGGTFPAQIWARYMGDALVGLPGPEFASADAPHYLWADNWSRATPPKPPSTPNTTVRQKQQPTPKPTPAPPAKHTPKPKPPPPPPPPSPPGTGTKNP